MRTPIISLCFITFVMAMSIAQTKAPIKMDTPPIFPGCEQSQDPISCFNKKMKKHISDHFKYPELALMKEQEGKVIIQITIDADGYVSNIKKKGPSPYLEDEAVRIMKKLPRMTPATFQGKNIKVPYSVPITFKLSRDQLRKLKKMKKHVKEVNEFIKH